MTMLTNRHTAEVAVMEAGARVAIAPGDSIEVDGRQNWNDHIFIKAGWLEIAEPEKPRRKSKPVEPVEAEQDDAE